MLTGMGATAAMALAPTASARITRRVVIPESEEYVESGDYTGYFLHVGSDSTGELTPSDVAGCGFDGWDPEQIDAFDGRLVDRVEDHSDHATQVYATGEIAPGALFVVNDQVTCPDGYVGLEVERIGVERVRDSEQVAESTPSGGAGPGFGVLAAALGTALAAGHRLRS